MEDIRLECYGKLMHLSWRIIRRSRKNLSSLGFAWNQYTVLKHICPGESITLSELSSRTFRDSSNITALVDFLEDKGLVERIHDKSDRRVIRVELTDKGEDVRKDVIEKHETFIASMFENIADEDMEEFIRLLDIMNRDINLPDRGC